MSKNKHIRKLIAGQLRTIARHNEKIREELLEQLQIPIASNNGRGKLTLPEGT